MKLVGLTALTAASLLAEPAWARGPDTMRDWMGRGWDGMWFGPLFIIPLLAVQIAGTVALVRWIGGDRRDDIAGRT
jgi:hypothetical protein